MSRLPGCLFKFIQKQPREVLILSDLYGTGQSGKLLERSYHRRSTYQYAEARIE